jgi:hypothetical protein
LLEEIQVMYPVKQPNRTEIARRILIYLDENPDAQDSIEGILQWWLLERTVHYEKIKVEEVIEELVSRNLIVARQNAGLPIRYSLNPSKLEEIRLAYRKKSKKGTKKARKH